MKQGEGKRKIDGEELAISALKMLSLSQEWHSEHSYNILNYVFLQIQPVFRSFGSTGPISWYRFSVPKFKMLQPAHYDAEPYACKRNLS